MPIGVIAYLKMIDIQKNNAKADTVVLVLMYPGLKGNVRVPPVADAGQAVKVGFLLEQLQFLQQLDGAGVVGKYLDRSDNLSLVVTHRGYTYRYREAVSLFMAKIHIVFTDDAVSQGE